VLYGSDAIGGVINTITLRPGSSTGKSDNGEVLLRGGTADDQAFGAAKLFGDVGRVSYRAAGRYRSTNPYQAPAESFGDLTFSKPRTVPVCTQKHPAKSIIAGRWPITEPWYTSIQHGGR